MYDTLQLLWGGGGGGAAALAGTEEDNREPGASAECRTVELPTAV